jgi:uncharacterized protein YndB with AHSA1/START domain
MGDRSVERVAQLPAPREDVWDALTRADRLSEWFGAEVIESDFRPGGRLVFRAGDGLIRRALVETVERPALLVFRWLAIEEGPDGTTRPVPSTTVEIRLAENGRGTELTVVETPRTLSRL